MLPVNVCHILLFRRHFLFLADHIEKRVKIDKRLVKSETVQEIVLQEAFTLTQD